MRDKECAEYYKTGFAEDLIALIAHDKEEFDRPPKWKEADILTSPLFIDFGSLWKKVSSIYNTEVSALSYGTIPTSDEILESVSRLFEDVKKIIK